VLRSFVPFLAPLLLAAAPAVPSASTLSLTPWWEKVTVTMTDDGKAQGCRYESSATGSPNKDCKVVGASIGAQAAPSHDQYATITFERRFDPGGAPPADAVMQKGDKLLGRQVMALAAIARSSRPAARPAWNMDARRRPPSTLKPRPQLRVS